MERMKGYLKALAVLAVFSTLGWTGMYLYWHFKILGAIHAIHSEAGPPKQGSPRPYTVPEEPLLEVRESGCRALPYLVAALDPAKEPAFLNAISDLIVSAVTPDGSPAPTTRVPLPEDARISYEDPPQDRAKKCAAIKDWWAKFGAQYHSGFRLWTGRCAKD